MTDPASEGRASSQIKRPSEPTAAPPRCFAEEETSAAVNGDFHAPYGATSHCCICPISTQRIQPVHNQKHVTREKMHNSSRYNLDANSNPRLSAAKTQSASDQACRARYHSSFKTETKSKLQCRYSPTYSLLLAKRGLCVRGEEFKHNFRIVAFLGFKELRHSCISKAFFVV